MKRWAWLTVLLYSCVLILLSAPVLMLAGLKWSSQAHKWQPEISWSQAFELYWQWGYWLWMAVLLGCQWVLLMIPVRIAERRPLARRRIGLAVTTIAFLLAALFLTAVLALASGLFGDHAFDPVDVFADKSSKNPILANLLSFLGLSMPGPIALSVAGVVAVFLTLWGLWFLLFYRFSISHDPESILARGTRWLLRGSILELLIAVPSHIAVRRRDECCAPASTFLGIATGISLMLISFGPGVFWLFVQRVKKLKPKVPAEPSSIEETPN